MMKLKANKGSGSATIPITQQQVFVIEGWARMQFAPDPERDSHRKTVYHPRGNLSFEKVGCRRKLRV